MKEKSYYFKHDNNARSDPKLQEVMMDMGMAGIGLYWCIVEQLYEQDGSLPLASVKSIAFALHVNADEVLRLINDFGLFDKNETVFWSNSVNRRMKEMNDLSEKRSAAGIKGNKKRWGKSQSDSKNIAKVSQTDDNATLRLSQNIAIKENKIKGDKIKENEIKGECNTSHALDDFLMRFFRPENEQIINKLCSQLNKDIVTVTKTAEDVVNEWKITEQTHKDYNDAARHLITLLDKRLRETPAEADSVKGAEAGNKDWRAWEEEERDRKAKEREKWKKEACPYEKWAGDKQTNSVN